MLSFQLMPGPPYVFGAFLVLCAIFVATFIPTKTVLETSKCKFILCFLQSSLTNVHRRYSIGYALRNGKRTKGTGNFEPTYNR